MTTQHRLSSLAVAIATFAMACADPTMPSRTLLSGAPLLGVSQSVAYPFDGGALTDGEVELCKTSDVGGVFDFTATGPAGTDLTPSITIPAGGSTECVTVYTSQTPNSGPSGGVQTVVITEIANPAAALTSIDIIKYFAPNPFNAGDYTAGAQDDSENGTTATLRINHDMARRVTFTNTAPDPEPEVCDFITFGRLVTEVGGKKVVISGNAGGNNADGSIKNEFHITYLGVDYHVADATSYGPIDVGPLSDETLYPNARVVTGIAKNGVAVELRLWDGGEPGKNTDKVWFSLGTPVNATIGGANGQFINQGNMQYHSNCRGPG